MLNLEAFDLKRYLGNMIPLIDNESAIELVEMLTKRKKSGKKGLR